MAASNARAIERPEEVVQQSSADWMASYKDNLDAMLASGQAVISGYQAVATELLAFYQSRLKNGLDVSKRLAECTSPDAAAEVQIEFANGALKAYLDEFKKVGELSGKVATEAFAPLRARASEAAGKAEESAAA